MQIYDVDSISLTAQFSDGHLEVLYQGRSFTELEDTFGATSPAADVVATIGDFTDPSGVVYAVFAFTRTGSTVVPWTKTGAINTSPAIPVPTGRQVNELSFAIAAIPVDVTRAVHILDPKIRVTRQAGTDR